MNDRKLMPILVVIGGFALAKLCFAQGNPASSQPSLSGAHQQALGFPNWSTPTLGGKQFWTDYIIRQGWRIQQNSESGHYRLLDDQNVRRAWGNFEHCRNQLLAIQAAGRVKPFQGKVVVLLHGLIRTSQSMDDLEAYLHKQGFDTANFRYASTRKEIQDHAQALHSVITNLGDQVTDIYFVGHSMGNLVVRRYLHDRQHTDGRQGDPRIRRMVMIGPPNQGSKMARMLNRSVLFHTLAGKSGAQLSARWQVIQPTLATPKFEFGIIAGGQASERQFNNWLLNGPDDFTVSVEETKLVGASDFFVKPLLHSTMSRQPEVLLATHRFFVHGYFASEAERKRIQSGASPSQ